MGVLLQLNSWCLVDPPGKPTRDFAERWLREGQYFLIGTDTHNASMRTRIRGMQEAQRIVGAEQFDRLTVANPRSLLPEEDWTNFWPARPAIQSHLWP
jgi:tyrosine-protein phosphatase YwqE